MNKLGLIFRHEIIKKIKSAGYIILTLSVPVTALFGIGLFKLAQSAFEGGRDVVDVIGYVDKAGLSNDTLDMGDTTFIAYETQEEANEALTAGQITEFIVIPGDYRHKGTIQRYTPEKEANTPIQVSEIIQAFLTANLLKEDVLPETIGRVLTPVEIETIWVTEDGEIALEANNPANVIIPGVFALLLSLGLMMGTTSLINGLGEEKENRLIEVLFSSVSIRDLLAGKILALGLAGLIQALVWLISMPLLLKFASSTFGDLLRGIEIPANFIALGVVYYILGYLLFAVLAVGIGAISQNATEGNSISMFYVMATFIPLWLLGLQMSFPNSPIWTALALIPVTAPIQTMVRLGISEIPLWQIVTNISLLLVSIVGGFFLIIRFFRTYMLMYGKRPGLKEIIRNLRAA